MKKFSQFLGIRRGKNNFKQAPNAVLVQSIIGSSSNSGFNGVITEVLMAEQSVTPGEWGFIGITDQMGDNYLADGETYVVTIDGTPYRCEVWGHPLDATYKYIGDGRILDDGSADFANIHPENVPFAIENCCAEGDPLWGIEESNEWYVYFPDTNTHTVKVERETVIPKTVFTVTGDESFNFQVANNTVYYKNNQFTNVPHDNIVYAECTHFEWGDGAVIADMKDGQFIFNYTKSSGIGTGNISFKRDDLFTSASVAKDWFRAQAANGTPVIITVYVKK